MVAVVDHRQLADKLWQSSEHSFACLWQWQWDRSYNETI